MGTSRTLTDYFNILVDWVSNPENWTMLTSQIGILIAVIIGCWVLNFVARGLLLRSLKRLIKKTKFTWDDLLLERHVLDRLSHLVPAAAIYFSAPVLFPFSDDLQALTQRLMVATMIAITVRVISATVSTLADGAKALPAFKDKPLTSYVQIVKLVLYIAGGVVVVAIILDRSPWVFVSGVGALTAVLLLVFKDVILGLVASIQITANDMLRPNDWIEMPQYGADGSVLDVSLSSVKVQNWDKTITTIPTYALVSGSFKNWRGMEESGGRRIKRAIHIDMNTVKICDSTLLKTLSDIHILSDYLRSKQVDIRDHNANLPVQDHLQLNGRQLTNVGTFRAYIEAYVKANPVISDTMTVLVRQLAPGATGLPIEIYVFSTEQEWIAFENIQADIFDHLLAMLPVFELQVFQNPSGSDFKQLTANSTH